MNEQTNKMATNKKTIEMYDGSNITFYPDSHRYKKEGDTKYMLSPSAITGLIDKSTALLIWNDGLIRSYFMSNIEEDKNYLSEEIKEHLEQALQQRTVKVEEAKTFGSMVHDYAEAYAHAKVFGGDMPVVPDDAPKEVLNGISAFLDWNDAHKVEYIDTERMVYSSDHQFVGHFDVLAMVDGKLTLIDYKTSKRVYTSQQYQLCAYKLAYEEEAKFKGKFENLDLMILDFNKETGELIEFPISQEDYEKNVPAFLGLLACKKREKELSTWGD